MATRYIIGKGELLTYAIPAPKMHPSAKKRPYTLAENLDIVVPQIKSAVLQIQSLPDTSCPYDVAVLRMTLHPTYIAKSWFPAHLLREVRLVSMGSKTVRIRPRTVVRKNAPEEQDTTMLFVAGEREVLGRFAELAQSFDEQSAPGIQFGEIESIAPMLANDRISPFGRKDTEVFEVCMHIWPDGEFENQRGLFKRHATACGFKVRDSLGFVVGMLYFTAVEGPHDRLKELAKYTLLRVVRPMPKLRGVPNVQRGQALVIPFQMPKMAPLSREPRVAVLDGGLPDKHVLEPFVNRYFVSDDSAKDVPEYVDHGLGVTSAVLFGPLEPNADAPRPHAYVDHHRVLDERVKGEDPYELYRTLGHVEDILLSRQYQFINLSLGPDWPIDDGEVHAWTAVIDQHLSDGETLLTVAAGNNGMADRARRFDRIQVPADCVNAVAVGATNVSGEDWVRANYSARGPGRQPGRRKPDLVSFGGSPKEYFHVAARGASHQLAPLAGTSFSAPNVLRAAVGVRAVLGADIYPLTIRALLVHCAEAHATPIAEDHGWGRITGDINSMITCPDGVARVIYQGTLRPGKFLRAAVPLPKYVCEGFVTIRATFCYASPTDPQDASAYTKAGLGITFRPNDDKRKEGAASPTTKSFFQDSAFKTEAELRDDLGKWETVLSAERRFRGSSLKNPVFDVHYNARDHGDLARGTAEPIPYALVLTIDAQKHPHIYDDILAAHVVLRPIEPAVSVPLST